MLSLGLDGNIDGLGWLLGALLQNSVLLLMVNHPAGTGGDSSPRRRIRIWERQWGVGAAPDKLLSDLILPWILAPTDLQDWLFVGVVTVLKLVCLRRGIAVFEASCTQSNAHNLG